MHSEDRLIPATIRVATAADADAIASLHAASWSAHYRGSLSDAYLDGPIEAERRAVWTERLAHPRAGQVVLVAEDERQNLIGFVCLFLNHDREFGCLVDNLHVTIGSKRKGLGRRLMQVAGEAMLHALPRRPAFLYVLEANHAACRFYERIGGTLTGRGRKTEADGSDVAVLRYMWATPDLLVDATSTS